MKSIKTFALPLIMGSAILLAGCQAPYSGGLIFNNYNAPVDVRDNAGSCDKRGEAVMTNVLGFFAVGDASVGAAKTNGKITQVSSVDVNFQSLLGIFGKTTTIVCGK